MRYFLEISYLGTRYAGWQKQPGKATVQSEIEAALKLLFPGEKPTTTGCGRTDAGVHARQFYLHFDSENSLLPEFEKRLNRMLPPDICCKRAFLADDSVHARFSAILRSYQYQIHFQKDPMLLERSWYFPYGLPDKAILENLASFLLTISDFTSLSKRSPDNDSRICNLSEARFDWEDKQNRLFFHVSANRFLHNMVRRIVGALMMAGIGKIAPETFCETISNRQWFKRAVMAPPDGLYLDAVVYPNLI